MRSWNSSGVQNCTGADSLKSLHIFLQQANFSIYDAQIVIVAGSQDSDTGATIESLGTLTGGQELSLSLPLFGDEVIILEGSSTEGGANNIFAGPSGGISGNTLDPQSMGFTITNSQGIISGDDIAFYEQQSNGAFSLLGNARLSGGVPEVGTWWMMVLGFFGLGSAMRRGRASELCLLR